MILSYRGGDDPAAYERMKADVLEALQQHFRPEFLNRVDETVVFHSLSRAHLKRIVDIQLRHLRRLAERHISLELTERARIFGHRRVRPELRGSSPQSSAAAGGRNRARAQAAGRRHLDA